MHEILLLGDSIRMAYQNRVKELLGNEYNVSAPGENCRFAAYTLNSLRYWLADIPKPEVIHWNNGLWDTAILYPEDGCFTHLNDYIETLSKILRVLKSTGAKVIFATSTPVDPKKEFLNTAASSCHRNCDIERYNLHAAELMKSNGVPINDLWSVIYPQISEYISEDLIHPTDSGVEALARAVAIKIKNTVYKGLLN
jgi:hypothetical protein